MREYERERFKRTPAGWWDDVVSHPSPFALSQIFGAAEDLRAPCSDRVLLQLPNAKAAAGKLPQQPGQGSLSARASQPPDEWHNFRQRLDLRRSVPLRAVAGNVRSDVVLPRLTNGPPPAPVIPMPHQRMELPFLEGVRRGRRQPDGLAAVFDYNFSCEQPHARPKPRATRLAPSYEPDEHIFNADEAYAIACRGVAQARRQARKIDNEFISLLVHSEAVRITEHRISQM